jgi:hypothetical protein
VTDTSEIVFIPQGIALLFYGTGALGLGLYIALTILLEYWEDITNFLDNIVRIVRQGFPGKNHTSFIL